MMRKLTEITVFTAIALLWALSVISIPLIPDPCCVCHEKTRTRTIVEWFYTGTPSLHFDCSHKYDAAIHNPNGGIK